MKHKTIRLSIQEIQNLVETLAYEDARKMVLQLAPGCAYSRTTVEHKLSIKRKRTIWEVLRSWLK